MKMLLVLMVAVAAGLFAGQGALAQSVLPGASQFNPPLPAPPPPPRIEVPKVPQLDARPTYNYRPAPRASFGDRIVRCLDDAAAAGLGPNDRASYSRSCANQ